MSAKLILNAVWARILASPINATLGGTALLGGRICLDQLPADTALPCVVYAIDRMDTGKSFGDDERFDLTLSFTMYQGGQNGLDIYALSEQILSALTAKLSPTGFDRFTLTRVSCGVPSFADDCWTMTDTYRGVGYLLKTS